MTNYTDEDTQYVPRWRHAAVEVFEAYMNCMHKNLPDEAERTEAHRFFLHKLVWLHSGENSVADEVDRKIFVSLEEE